MSRVLSEDEKSLIRRMDEAIAESIMNPVELENGWSCLLCGRDNLQWAGQPHTCIHGQFRKKFSKYAKLRGRPCAFITTWSKYRTGIPPCKPTQDIK